MGFPSLLQNPTLNKRRNKKYAKTPSRRVRGSGNVCPVNLLLLIIVLLLLFGGGGSHVGGPAFGGGDLGLVLLIVLVVYLMGGFRGRH